MSIGHMMTGDPAGRPQPLVPAKVKTVLDSREKQSCGGKGTRIHSRCLEAPQGKGKRELQGNDNDRQGIGKNGVETYDVLPFPVQHSPK